jgi:hypothetical protein
MRFFQLSVAGLIAAVILASACGTETKQPVAGSMPTALSEVPAVRLNFRYEADVPPPEIPAMAAEERNAAVQNSFDSARPGEILDRMITSPNKRRVLAVYHLPTDEMAEFRLDMYSADGVLLNKMTPETMAVHFPDTIVWAPDSSSVAFVAMVRGAQGERPDGAPGEGPEPAGVVPQESENANSNTSPDANSDVNAVPEETPAAPAEPTPTPPIGVLTFRTEQIYLSDADGAGVKPITQTEGLIYFYYGWAPDSSMLVALAATAREWQYLQYRADEKGEVFVPVGRPRIVEKTGRERRLDDGLTAVQPVWSPDSSKVAAAYESQIRIYDSAGTVPTQAAVPLRNSLLISSQAYDLQQQNKLGEGNVESAPAAPQSPTTLPDPNTLVSFNPIVSLVWSTNEIINFQTAFIKRMKIEADSVTSYSRWHRIILSAQAMPTSQQ